MSTIDGERKALVRRIDPVRSMYVGLLVRSQWQDRKAVVGETLVTMRALHGALLHDQSLKNQTPPVGHIFPAALLAKRSGRKRTGKAMDAHLTAISTRRAAERAALKQINAIKVI